MTNRPLPITYTRWILINHEWVQITVAVPQPCNSKQATETLNKVASAITVILGAMSE